MGVSKLMQLFPVQAEVVTSCMVRVHVALERGALLVANAECMLQKEN